MTIRPRTFQNFFVIKTGDSDFHKMTATVLRSYFAKLETQIIKKQRMQEIPKDS